MSPMEVVSDSESAVAVSVDPVMLVLPPEVVFQVLLLVDADTLVRCALGVCKRWRALLCDGDGVFSPLFARIWLDPTRVPAHAELAHFGVKMARLHISVFCTFCDAVQSHVDHENGEQDFPVHPPPASPFPHVTSLRLSGSLLCPLHIHRFITPTLTHLDLTDCTTPFLSNPARDILTRLTPTLTHLTALPLSHSHMAFPNLLITFKNLTSLTCPALPMLSFPALLACAAPLRTLTVDRAAQVFNAHRGLEVLRERRARFALQSLTLRRIDAMYAEDAALFLRLVVGCFACYPMEGGAEAVGWDGGDESPIEGGGEWGYEGRGASLRLLRVGCEAQSHLFDAGKYRQQGSSFGSGGSGCSAPSRGNDAAADTLGQLTLRPIVEGLRRDGLIGAECRVIVEP
ncbi:hypothetical protein BC830DRAFT_1167350 [Chytriomyces sp. MP71]|nr:hypothetical protein BC830DRAFT_1167350 [Chytriomyces sp. MP71]